MQRLLTIALLLLSLTFLGQARVDPFSCGATVVYSGTSDSGCQKGCCKNSSCCKTQRPKEAAPSYSNGSLIAKLDSVDGNFLLSRLLLILPVPTGSVESIDTVGYSPAVQTTNCVRLI
jgi:hypothetical protein